MTELEAIQARHSVRKYSEQPIEESKLAQLREEIQKCNAEAGIHIQLVVDEPKAFSTGVFKYGAFSGVRNYLVLAGKKEAEERIGYYGEHIVLLAQTLGLNTCWVALTYKKIPGTFTLKEGERVHCVIALGYGVIQGVQHPMKSVEKFYESEGVPPEWFLSGVEAARLAPTAVNQQKFRFVLQDGNKVQAQTLFSLVGYTKIDLGIVKYHFEIGAGKEHFTWA
ncbi:MAG: nitroreductase [Bacteroidales bacterium]|nr:nitroreductase [Bacteroidales bacterium]